MASRSGSSGRTSTPGTNMSRTTTPFGLFEDERPASKRATRDAVVRLTRLPTPELEAIALRHGSPEEMHLMAQSSSAAEDGLARKLGSATLARSGGAKLGRHRRHGDSTQLSSALTRPLSGVSRPASPSDSLYGSTFGDLDNIDDNAVGGAGSNNAGGRGSDLPGPEGSDGASPNRRPRPATPPTPLLGSPRDGSNGNALTRTAQRNLSGDTRGYQTYHSGGSGSGMVDSGNSYHSGSADTLPSKARALINRYSYYSSGMRDHAGERPRDHTVLGEPRGSRVSLGSKRVFRSRRLLASHGLNADDADVSDLEAALGPSNSQADRSGEAVRVYKVKQLIRLMMYGKGKGARAKLERSFRLADKDGSGYLAFDELNYALCSDFAVPGLTQGDVRRLFAAIDVDGSGEVSCDEFIDAIESVPLPELKHKVGYRSLPSPAFLKTRFAFQVWPTTVDLGSFEWQKRSVQRVELTLRNVGYGDARFRVKVQHLDPHKGQEAVILDQPRGGIAPGMCSRVAVSFSSVQRGTLTALVCIETADQRCEVPVMGYCTDGQDQLDDIHGLPSAVLEPNELITSPIKASQIKAAAAAATDASSATAAATQAALPTLPVRHQQVGHKSGGGKGKEIQTISGDHEGWFGEVSDGSTLVPENNDEFAATTDAASM